MFYWIIHILSFVLPLISLILIIVPIFYYTKISMITKILCVLVSSMFGNIFLAWQMIYQNYFVRREYWEDLSLVSSEYTLGCVFFVITMGVLNIFTFIFLRKSLQE